MSLTREESELALRAACCLAAVDGRLTRSEIGSIANVLSASGAPLEVITDEYILEIARRVHRDGVKQTAISVREQLMWSRTTNASSAITMIYDSMKAATPSDEQRLSQIMLKIVPHGLPHQNNASQAANSSCGQRLPHKAITVLRRARWLSVAALFSLVVGVGCVLFVWFSGNVEHRVINRFKAAVKAQLKNPASASFEDTSIRLCPLPTCRRLNLPANGYVITSIVRATNSFGGIVPEKWVGFFDKNGDAFYVGDEREVPKNFTLAELKAIVDSGWSW